MVFPFVPVVASLDPHNWQLPLSHQQAGVITSENHYNPQLLPPTPPPGYGGVVGGVRPGSTTERARLANIQKPETALKCPRCESTDTKFCYFNNYSLSQPRYLCKTCKRYWTIGGALRNVPVGGGCRRNKRSERSKRTKSPSVLVSDGRQTGSSSSSSALTPNSCTNMLAHMNPAPPQLPHLSPLHHLGDCNSGDTGVNFGGIQFQVASTGGGTSASNMDFQTGTSSSGGRSMLTNGLLEQWRLQQVQQFPFLTVLEPPTGLYPFEGEGPEEAPSYGGHHHQLRSITEFEAVKMEETQQLNLSRIFLGTSGSDQYS